MGTSQNLLYRLLARKPSQVKEPNQKFGVPVRLSGTTPAMDASIVPHPKDGDLDAPIGRTGNDWEYPDTNGAFNQPATGDRLQDIANSHLNEGPAPGKIPHLFNMRVHGKLGRELTGSPAGSIGFDNTTSGQSAGGIGDMKYIPHIQIVRGGGNAKPFLRTVDDAAPVPGIFVADPTRH